LNNPLRNVDPSGLVYCAQDDSGNPDLTQCVSDDEYNGNPGAFSGWVYYSLMQSVTVTDTNNYTDYQSLPGFVLQLLPFTATLHLAIQNTPQINGPSMVPTPKPKPPTQNKPPASLCFENPAWAVGNPIYGPSEPTGNTSGSGNWAVYSATGSARLPFKEGYQYGSETGAAQGDALALGADQVLAFAQCMAMAF
jgi:hypothetical protein